MGWYMKEEIERMGDEGHYLFVAKFGWKGSLTSSTQSRLNKYLHAVGDENNENEHTGIHKQTLQAYYLKKFDSTTPEGFVIIGHQHPKKKKSRWGLEEFCSRLIFGTVLDGAMYQAVEANDLKNVHG